MKKKSFAKIKMVKCFFQCGAKSEENYILFTSSRHLLLWWIRKESKQQIYVPLSEREPCHVNPFVQIEADQDIISHKT